MKFFLKIKGWQLFFLVFVIPFLAQTVPLSTENIDLVFVIYPIILTISILVLIAWMWSIGDFSNGLIPREIRPSKSLFTMFIIYVVFYLVFYQANFIRASIGESSLLTPAVIFPLHLFGMACMFYSLYFVAKNLKMAETDELASFSQYSGVFFLMWFFPVGVFFVQPRINALYDDKNT